MPRTIRYHLDENCHRAIADGLKRRGINVTTTAEAGLLSATDDRQAAYGLAHGRVIVTHDPDFLRLHAGRVPHAGIAFSAKGRRRIGDMVRRLVLLWEVLDAEDMRNRVEFL